MPSPSYQELIGTWETLHRNLGARLAELPQLAQAHADLGPLLAEAAALESAQDRAKAELRAVNQRRSEIRVAGRTLRNRIAAGLQSAFGLESETLLAFGVKPRARRIRRRRPSSAEKQELLARAAGRAVAEARAEAAAKAPAEAKLAAIAAPPLPID